MSASEMFRTTFTKNNLTRLYHDEIKYKPSVGVDGITRKIFESRLKENVDVIYRKAWATKYKFSQYREKLISKGANKPPRCISVPTMRDKLLLKALFTVLGSVFPEASRSLHEIISDIASSLARCEYDGVLRLDIKVIYTKTATMPSSEPV